MANQPLASHHSEKALMQEIEFPCPYKTSSLLSSIIVGEIMSKTNKEERFLNKKKTRETDKKYQLPAKIPASSFCCPC